MVSKLIGALVAMVIGLALLPVVGDFASDLTGDGGQFEDTTTGALIDLLPIVYVIILVAAGVGYIAVGRRN
jgi:hypothetical protein